MKELIERLVSEWRGGRSGRYSGDPMWIKARRPGVDVNGKPFKRGAEVLYYPSTKSIISGKEAEQAWREFEAARGRRDVHVSWDVLGDTMRHTNLSSAVRHAKKLAKEKGKPHFAHGASGRYRVTDRKPEDTSFVQATPSGGEWSHKMNQSTKTFTKSRIFGGVTMESVEREWGESSTGKLLARLQEGSAAPSMFRGWVENVSKVLKEAIPNMEMWSTTSKEKTAVAAVKKAKAALDKV